MGFLIFEYKPQVTSSRACGVTENDLPNCHRAVNKKTAAGTAIHNPVMRAAFHPPGRNITAEMAISTMQNCRMKNGVIFPLSATEADMVVILQTPGEHCG